MPARPEQATASREERATTASNGRTTVASRGIQRAGQAPVITPVNQTVPMTDALIGRACSTHADLRRRTPWSSHSLVALLVFALLYVVDARARTAATWAPSARHNRRRPPFPTPPMRPGFPSESPPSTLASIRASRSARWPSASRAHLAAGSASYAGGSSLCTPRGLRGKTPFAARHDVDTERIAAKRQPPSLREISDL